jgi:hypothetical protein
MAITPSLNASSRAVVMDVDFTSSALTSLQLAFTDWPSREIKKSADRPISS